MTFGYEMNYQPPTERNTKTIPRYQLKNHVQNMKARHHKNYNKLVLNPQREKQQPKNAPMVSFAYLKY